MSDPRQDLGRWGEETAVNYLKEHGYDILARNLHLPHGEIDIVASREDATIFVEVRTRSTASFGNPEDTVTYRKQVFMKAAAQAYFERHPESPESWQFDVIAITGRPGREFHLEHFENVIG